MTQLTTKDVAKALGIAESTVRGYKARERMPAPTGHVGATPYWDAEDIQPWIDGYLDGAASRRREVARRRSAMAADPSGGLHD